jgi:hypothetical protein
MPHPIPHQRRRLPWLSAAALCALLACQPAIAAQAPAPATAKPADGAVAQSWRRLTEADIDYFETLVPTHYIYAVHPGGPAWDAKFKALVARARREAAGVDGYGGYRAVMQHLVAGFEDAHFSVRFALSPQVPRWPGFLVRYRANGYEVVYSRDKAVRAGARIESCDGRPVDAWIDELAEYEGGPKGLVSTRARLTGKLFIDVQSPLHALPQTCMIDGAGTALKWRFASNDSFGTEPILDKVSEPFEPLHDESSSITGFGANGAWVRLGTMMPVTADTADQFNKVIAGAPALRDKDIIVLDVRGNPGGSYAWFMAFLRALYGADYADYYARARLEITNVMMLLGPYGSDDPGFTPETNAIHQPSDPQMEAKLGPPQVEKLPSGISLVTMKAPVTALPPRPAAPPADPVKAKVYVLTDYGCASACLSFLDEMMRFPGVVQIGTETHIDRRSAGWPTVYDLPSGLGFLRMGRLVRDGRMRGENQPWTPAHVFPGDIADTAAVKQWVAQTFAPAAKPR